MRIVAIFMLVFLTACAEIYEGFSEHEEHTEILTLGPYTVRCVGAFEQDCFMEYNDAAKRWEFFYEGIQGFDFEPGYIYTLEVRLEDRGTEIQDVGRYSYHLIKIVYKVKAPDDFNYAKNEKPQLSDLESGA